MDFNFKDIDVGDLMGSLGTFVGIVLAYGGYLAGKKRGIAEAAKSVAEAEKIKAEADQIRTNIAATLEQNAENSETRLRDQILVSFKTLAENYERQLALMQKNLETMEAELSTLSRENGKLQRTVDELGLDNIKLQTTVTDLHKTIDVLITLLRENGVKIDDLPVPLALPRK